MQIQRCKLSFNKSQLKALKEFLKGESSNVEAIVLRDTFVNGNMVEIFFEIKEDASLNMNIGLLDKFKKHLIPLTTLENVNLNLYNEKSIYQILEVKHEDVLYLIKIESNLQKKEFLNKLPKFDLNFNNLLLYNDFNQEIELLEVVYHFLSNSVLRNRVDLIPKETLELIKEKFAYYGYADHNAKETYEIIEEETTREEIIDNLVGILLSELYYPRENRKDRLIPDDIKKYTKEKVNKYLKLL